MAERPLYTLYKNLKAQNYDVPNDYNKFESALTRDGKSGADNRHAIYENLKAQNFDVPDTYERFYSALFEPRSKTSSRAKGGSVPMSAADRARYLSVTQSVLNTARQVKRASGNIRKTVERAKKFNANDGNVTIGFKNPLQNKNVQKNKFNYNKTTGKTGTYTTTDGVEFDNEYDAAQHQNKLDKYGEEWNKAVDMGIVPSELDKADPDLSDTDVAMRQMERRQEWLDENQNRRSKELNESMHLQGSPFVASGGAVAPSSFNTAISNEANRLSDVEYGAYNTAKAYNQMLRTTLLQELKEQKQRNENAGWWKDKWNDVSNYFGGMLDTMFDPKLFSQGVMDAAMANNMLQVKKGIEDGTIKKGSNAGNAAQAMLGAIQQQQGESAKQQQNGAKAYQYGDMSGRSLKFMGDFLTSGWRNVMTTGFTKAGEKVGEKMALGTLGKWFTKNTGRVLGDMAGSAALASTNQLGSTYNNVIERYVGMNNENGGVTQDKNGDLKFNEGVSLGKAIKDGFGSATIENFSEMFGEYLPGASKLLSKLGLSKVSSFFEKIGNNAYYKWLSNATNKSGIQGVMAEISEEEFGTALHAAWGDGDGRWSDFNVFTNPDAREKQIDTCLGMFYSVGFMQAPRTSVGAINAVQYFKIKHQVNKADKFGQGLFNDNWDEIKSKIDVSTNADLTKTVLDATRSESMTAKQKGAVINYAMFLSKLRGFNQASDAKTKDKVEEGDTAPTLSNDLDDAYTEGYNADDADKHDIQIQQEDQMKTLAAALGISEQQLSGMSDEELESLTGQDDKLDQAIYDYQLSTARYQGVVDDAQDKVDLAAHQATQKVDMYTDRSRGSVRNATIKASGGAEDYGVYIISGNIATNDDGSIDVRNSDDMILYYDPTTNSVEHADAFMFAELGEELPADDVKAQAVADAKENTIKEIAGIIDGTVEVGSQFSVTDADGTEHTYEVLADNGDGTAMITIDGNVPTELVKGENVQIPYSFADLQQMKDLEDQKRLEAAKAEREQMEKERDAQQTEQTQPSFDFNQILNDDGNVVLVDVLGKDGNTKYPNSQLFLIRDSGVKAKVVELTSDGSLIPHAVNKKDVRTATTMTLEEYKQAFADSSMIEDNSGENRGEIEAEPATIEDETTPEVAENTETTAPSDETTETPSTKQTPAITLEDGTVVPILDDGNPDFSKLTAAQTAELYDTEFGEDADSIVSGYVSDAKKAIDKANNMTVKGKTFVEQKASKDAKEKAIADAQAAYDSAIAIRDAYNERQLAKVEDTAEGRKSLIEKARRKFARLKSAVKDDAEAVAQIYKETVGSILHRLYDGTGIDVTDTIPLTAEEYVASNLGAHSINYEGTETSKSVKQETGLSREDFAKTQLLAADGKGTTIDALVHSLWENRPSNLDSLDTQDIRNALIGVLTSGFKASEARSYVENIRIAQAEKLIEEERTAAENAAYYEQQKAKEEEDKKKAELEKKVEEEKKKAELEGEEINPLAERITETDEEVESDGKYGTIYNKVYLIDGDKRVTKVDEPDANGNYIGSYYMYDGKRFGDLFEVADYIDGKAEENESINTLTTEQQKAKEDGEKLGFPAVDKEGEPINEYVVELAEWAKEQGLKIDPTSKWNNYADLFIMCKDGFGVGTLVPDRGESINKVVYFPDNVQDFDQLWKLHEEFNVGRDIKHSADMDNEQTQGAMFYDGDTAREFKEFVDKKVEEQNKVFGEQIPETDLPFSAKDNGKQQTSSERAADVEKNKVDDMKVVDNIVGNKTRKAFERLAKMMGANIQWQYSDKLGNGWIQETTDADGNVHRTIFITLDSSITEGAQFIFGHEMTHQIKNLNPAAYNELTQLVIDTYGSDAFDKAVDDTMKRYSDAGFSGRARDYYAEEVVADSVGEMIRDLNLAHTLAMKMSHPLLAAIHEILQKIKLAFFGTEYSDVTKNIIRSIEQAYVKTANREAVDAATQEGEGGQRLSLRTKPEPKKTQKVYKLMRLGEYGKLYPLFIGSGEAIELGKWYDADSPKLQELTSLSSKDYVGIRTAKKDGASVKEEYHYGAYIVNNKTGEAMSLADFKAKYSKQFARMGNNPNKKAVDWATDNGYRWIKIEEKNQGQSRYGGEARSYYNYGINGSGSVSIFAMRPGWHAGSLPTMRQIGKGSAKNLRDDTFVWVEGEIPAEIDYNEEAQKNADKDIPDHIPTDGYYLKATNANKEASQADKVGWYVAGAFRANRIMSDKETRDIIDEWNAAHPYDNVEYDWKRESGKDFNAETMSLEDTPKFSLKVYHGSGADFTEFDFDHMGEGAGSQVFGWGGYVTSSEKIGKSYAGLTIKNRFPSEYDTAQKQYTLSHVETFILEGSDKNEAIQKVKGLYNESLDKIEHEHPENNYAISNLKERIETLEEMEKGKFPIPTMSLYEVDIPEDNGSNYLDWENPMSEEQINAIRDALAKNGVDVPSWEKRGFKLDLPFKDVYTAVLPMMMRFEPKEVSKFLSSLGFTGIKYPAGTIQGGAEEGDTNYVIFKPEDMKITEHTKFSLKSKPVRFEAGKKLSDEEKKEVLSTLKDAYKVNGVPYHIEETAGGKEKRVYEPTADSYVVSDITNRPLRYYITLPDGRVAHPTEVYPNISDNEVKSSATKQGLLDEEVDQIVSAAIGSMKDIADNAKAIEVLTELQNLPHETHDVGYGLNNAQSYNYKTGIFTSDADQAIDYVVRRMRRKEDVPAEIPAALKKAVADSYGMVDNLIDGMSSTKVSQAQSVDNEEPKTFEEFLNHPLLKFSIKNEEQRKAAEDAYEYASKLRPNKHAKYAIVDMGMPSKVPEYYEKKVLADNWRRFYNRAVHNELKDVRKKAWGNYKLFDLDRPFAEQVNEVKGDVPDEFNAPDTATNKDNIKGLYRQVSSVAEPRYSLKDEKIKSVAEKFGVNEDDVAMYANAVEKGSTAEAARARANIKRYLLQANEDKISSFKDIIKYTKPINEALKENFGDLDAMIEERRKQVEAQRNAMEAARKRAQEEEEKRQKHLDELSLIPTDELDKRYMDAIANNDESTAREMLDESARRNGYGDVDSDYQGQGAWAAPSNPQYESDEARRADIENSPDVNLEDIALGYNLQPDDYFDNPRAYMNNTAYGLESAHVIKNALDAIKNGEKDVKVKVYRAVPTSVKEGKLRNGDWVTPSKKYAEMHGDNRLEGKYRIIEDEVPANQLWWDGNDVNEFGFDDGKEYRYKNAKNNRKLNDLITYDNKGNVIPPSKRFNSRKSDIRFSLAGERGAAAADKADERTFRMDNLSVAKDMEKNKKKAKAIKAATGWERGADGKWRYEMPDVVLRDPKEWVNKKNLTLSDIINKPNDLFKEYPELFDAYPELKDMKIIKGRAKSGGVFYNNAITLNLGDIREAIKYDLDTHYKLANNSLKKTLVHEIQHYIQEQEGFAKGGNSEMIVDKNALDAIAKLRAEKDAVAKEFYAMSPDEQQRRKYEINNRYNDLTKQIERLEKSSRIGYDGYQRLAGEVEARNVSARLNMTPEERRKTLVESTEDVDRKDQIFLGVGDVSFSLRDMADGKESGADDMAEDLKSLNTPDEVDYAIKTAIDDMPSGWKMANKKMIHIAQALGENRNAEIAGEEPKFSLKDGTLIKAGTYFSGGGLVEEGLKGIIDPVVAVEYDEKISGVYRNNFGQHIVTADVRDVDPKELVKQIDGEVEYFHASPVCKNYSQAKSNHTEVELDKETAASTSEFINAIKPKVVTIENVKGYKDSEAMKIITDALDSNGYIWDADVYNAADYGGYTNRERLIVRAVRDGKLPEKPKKMARKSGWYEAVADIIPTLTEKKNGVAPWMDIRLKADGINWRNIDKPLYVMGSAYADGKIPHAFADELLPTLRTKSGDVIVMPDGKVYRAMGRVLARVSGVSDDYKMPHSENLSHTIIGNGIPTQLTEHVIAPLLQNTLRPTTPDDGNTKFSLRYDQFEHDLNQWKKDNNLPKDAQRPTIPQRNAGESAVDFLRRVDEYRKQMALWKTAPTYEQHLLSDDTALGEFNRELQRGSVLKRIAFQDSMLAIRKAQEAIMKEVGVDRLNMAEDAYTAENRSHGKGKNEFEEYNNEFLQPLRKAYHQMKKVLGDSYDNVRIYMMAKHGLERDAQMAFKKSLEADYEDVAQRSAAYKAYKGDMNRIINDSDLEFGRVDFNTWRQKDDALRAKYSPSYMSYRYDNDGTAYDYSGLSALFGGTDFEEAASKLVRDIESSHVVEVQDLWNATNAATKKILRDGYKAGMMSKDTYQYVRDMYSHYIPLRGWDGTTADQVWDYVGGGKGAFNQTLKTAHGRTSIADDPIAYIENMAESGILLNNKNWVKQHLMLLAQNHPTSLLTLSKAWYVKSTDANGNEEWIPATPQITSQMNSNQVKAAIDAFEQKMEQMEQTGDATQKRDGLNIAYPQTHSEEREHEVRVMKDGEEYVIYVNGDPQLAQAMNNTRAHRVREIQSGKLDRAAAWLGRKMAAAYTSLSPLFIPSNYFRDLTMTLASTAIREDAKYNYLLRKNLATSWNLGFMLRDYQNGKLREKVNNGNATQKEQMFYDFMMNGGETGFVSSLDVEDLKKKFKNDLKDLDRWRANPVKVGHTIMDIIEFLNRMIEDSNRFAVYMTSIQYGRSIDEAVNDAKDVTLNFNRKGTGEYGWQTIRNLYLFINPAVQSLQTLGALGKHHPFKFTVVTASWIASGVLVPIVNAALMQIAAAFGGGDGDDKKWYKDISKKYWQFTKWDRRNNLIMWFPFTHEFIKIPLAQEFRAFYGVGDMIASKMMGGELAEESWSQYAEDLLGQVVDMLPLDPTGYDGNIAVSLMPNPIRPIFELAFNVDFTGKPIFKDTEYNKYDPNFTKAYVGTPDWLVRVSKMVNSIGNDYPDVQQNSIDAFGDPRYNLNNPAVVDHVLSSYLGGAYTMGSQVLGLLTKSLNDPKEIKVADIPLFSKFVSNPDDRPVTKKQGDEFWNMKENHDRAANTLSKLKKQAKVDGDYSMLERFYGSEEYKQYKQDDVKVKKYEEDKKKERAEESGEEYRPHKLNAEDIYKAHATPKDDFEDLKLKQLYTKLNGFKSTYDLLVDTAPSQSDDYYNTNKAAIDAIDEISLDKQEISELKKGFLDDGKDAYNAEDMKRIRELRKKVLAVLEKSNKVVVANQKVKKK